jgi:hypothetical protein
VLRPVAYSAIALIGVQRYGSSGDLGNAERVNTSIDSRSLYCLLGGRVLRLMVLSLSRYVSILRATIWYRDNSLLCDKVLGEACSVVEMS